MIHPRVLLVALALLAAAPDTASAAERKTCLSPEQRRAVIAARKAVPLTRAMRTVKARISGEVVNARLCEHKRGLVYLRELKEPYSGRRALVGNQLYESIRIPREDRPARYRQFSRNYLFYDAPVGLFISMDRIMGPPQWSDVGGFIQNIMLLARAHGLHTCPQEAWTNWHKTLTPFLGLPPEHILFCGIALGYADEEAPINRWRSEREPLDAFTRFEGF